MSDILKRYKEANALQRTLFWAPSPLWGLVVPPVALFALIMYTMMSVCAILFGEAGGAEDHGGYF